MLIEAYSREDSFLRPKRMKMSSSSLGKERATVKHCILVVSVDFLVFSHDLRKLANDALNRRDISTCIYNQYP